LAQNPEPGAPAPSLPSRILIVDDHPVVRQGLMLALGRDPRLTLCGEADGMQSALAFIRESPPDLVLADLDLDGASGLDLVKELREGHPDLPVLILSMHDEEIYAERVLRAGARGYLMKNETPEKLVAGILAVLAGELVLSERMKGKILANLAGARERKPGYSIDRLTDRELEVFRLIGEGKTTRQAAEKLSLSIKTIEAHIAHVKRKLGVESGRDLQHKAFSWNTSSANPPAAG
jgi:DNA-binding NarL/FixJ family response regulator